MNLNMIVLKNIYLLTPGETSNHPFQFDKGSLLVKNGKIEKIYGTGETIRLEDAKKAEIIDGRFRHMVFPGFIQGHIHFCQTLHRNRAEQLPLIDWLKNEIWPYEAGLTRTTMGQSVLMSLKEILQSGVTSVLDMGTVHLQEEIFEIMETVGFRYTGGKAMMDHCPDAPEGLRESTDASIQRSMELYRQFHGKAEGLLQYAFAPRFVLSCSPDLLREVRKLSDSHNILIHTHASEHPAEVAAIREMHGCGNVAYLEKLGALNRHSVIAHMVHLDNSEKELLQTYKPAIIHCPTTNLKLGSGIAPIAEYLEKDIRVGLGSDGAPCNNSLSIFNEIKLAPLLQKGTLNDPLPLTAEDALRMVSTAGAKITRNEDRVGRLQEGMDADLVLLDMDTPQTFNFEKNPSAALVYGADARNVAGTMVRGKFLYRNGRFCSEIEDMETLFING